MSLVTLDAVKLHLGITRSDTDALLQSTIDAAESYVARKIGAGSILGPETVTQRAVGFRPALTLTTLPVVSVTSVTGSDGALVPLSSLDVDTHAGIIQNLSTYYYPASSWYAFPLPFYTVVYQAGFTTLDYDYAQAVKEVTRFFWGAQRGPATGGTPETARASADYIIAGLPGYGSA